MNCKWLAALVVAVALCGAGEAAAQKASVERIEILQAGLYTANVVRRDASPGTASGNTAITEGTNFYLQTTQVPARLGIRFGVEYRLIGSPEGERVQLRSVWRIPAPGITNPANGNTYRQSPRDFEALVGSRRTQGYGFDQAWEIVSGDWVYEIWDGSRLLMSKAFTVLTNRP